MSEPTPEPTPDKGAEPDKQEQTFTQVDVDRIVAERLKREREATRTKFGDYDELKAKAGEKATLEERVAQIEAAAQASEQRALRAEVANENGLTASQAKRLVGVTREELDADAKDLLTEIGAAKKNGNHVAREGNNPKPGTDGDPMRELTRRIFERAKSD